MRDFWPNSVDWKDIGLHVFVGIVLVLGMIFGGPWTAATVNTVFWMYREWLQHGKDFGKMGGQSHMEWVFPGIAGFIVAALV